MTAGQVLTWQGRVFPTFYHSDSGGFTEAAQSVFSGDGVPPLDGRPGRVLHGVPELHVDRDPPPRP